MAEQRLTRRACSYTGFNARLEPLDRGNTDVRGGSYSSCLGKIWVPPAGSWDAAPCWSRFRALPTIQLQFCWGREYCVV